MSPGQAAGAPLEQAAGRSVGRRSVLRGMAAGALAGGAGSILAACSRGLAAPASLGSGTVTIGFVTPLTGPLARFAPGDRFVLDAVRATSAYWRGFPVGGRKYKVSIVVADSQSDPNQAAQAARDLILSNHADMILATSAPETTNPVAEVCQAQGVPCLSTVCPWELWYAGLGGDPARPGTSFPYCALFFFGLREFRGCFVPMWRQVTDGRPVACMFPDDADGMAFRGGFEQLITESGFRPVDGGAYPDGTTSYAPMISRFKSERCELYAGAPLPADFTAFWQQASRQGFRPRLATVAKVLQFPADTVALGPLAANIATASWWGPYLPYRSSLDGRPARALADAYQARTGRQWVQTLGSSYTLFEIAREAFTAVSDPHDKAAVAAALHQVRYTGLCGPVDFASGPAPGVGIIKPVGVQWKQASGRSGFELKVVDSTLNPDVRPQARLVPTSR